MTLVMVGFVLTAQASFSLTWNYEDENEEIVEVAITQDTTIVVSDYEEDFFSGEDVMGVKGSATVASNPYNMTVNITRENTDARDEFCLGSCVGSNGELKQEIPVTLLSNYETWFTHFYPAKAGVTTIVYSFDDGNGKVINLTVKYSYQMDDTAVDAIATESKMTGIYNLLGQKMPTDDIQDLPTGIYVVNGKKIIKQ